MYTYVYVVFSTMLCSYKYVRMYSLIYFRAQLTPDPRSQISILTISSIKIGTGKYENCLNIVSDLKTLLIRIADTDLFQTILEGFILIAEKNRTSRSKGHGVGVATSVSR